jgi:hypothetical protein
MQMNSPTGDCRLSDTQGHRLEIRIDEVLQHFDRKQLEPVPALCHGTTPQYVDKPVEPRTQSLLNNTTTTPCSIPSPTAENKAPVGDLMHTIEIDGVPFTFDITTVPNPPTVSFTDNVESLFAARSTVCHSPSTSQLCPIHPQ